MPRGYTRRARKKTAADVYGEGIDTEDANDGFFVFKSPGSSEHGEQVPTDIFRHIMDFVPAYPYYFTLCRVSKQWYDEMENIAPTVEVLDAVNRFTIGRRTESDNDRIGTDTIKYIPLYTENPQIDIASIVTTKFPNVTTLRIDNNGHYYELRNVANIISKLKHLENLVFINNAHCQRSDLSSSFETLIKVFPRTLKSLTLVGFKFDYSYHSEAQVLQKLVDPTATCHMATVPCKLEELYLLHCYVTPHYTQSYIPHFNAIQEILGNKYKFLETDLTKKDDIIAYIRYMVKEGGDINHILCSNEKNIMCLAINSNTSDLFDFLWEELLEQAKTDQPLTISLPTVDSLMHGRNVSVIKHVVDRITEPNVPDKLKVNINAVCSSRGNYSRHYNCTLYARALVKGDTGGLTEFYEQKNVPLYTVGSTNLLLALCYESRCNLVEVTKVLQREPKMLMMGNSAGEIVQVNGEFIFEYQPICNLNQEDQRNVLELYYDSGVPLTMKSNKGEIPLLHACTHVLTSFVEFILPRMDDLGGIEKECIIMLFKSRSYHIPKMFVNRLGHEWIRSLRFDDDEKDIAMYATKHLWNNDLAGMYTYLYTTCGLDINYKLKNGNTVLHCTMDQYYLKECTHRLMDLGCSLETPNEAGVTYIERMLRKEERYGGFLRDLAEKEAGEKIEERLNSLRMKEGKNIYHIVFEAEEYYLYNYLNLNVLKDTKNWRLLQTPDDNGKTPLMMALESETTNRKKFTIEQTALLEYFTDLPVTIGGNMVPLQYLASKGLHRSALYKFYLDRSSLTAVSNVGDSTVLHTIVSNGTSVNAVEASLNRTKEKCTAEEFATFVNQRKGGDDGKTAIVLAAEMGALPIIELLIKFGASTDCKPYNLVQCMIDNGKTAAAMHCICGNAYNSEITVPMVVTTLRNFLLENEKKKEELIVAGLEKFTTAVSTEEKLAFLEAVLTVPDVMISEATSFGDHCSVFQLLCNAKKKALVEWIFEAYKDAFAEKSTLAQHPFELIATSEKLYKNNIFHFVCTDGDLQVLTKKPSEEGPQKVNQTAAKAIFSKLLSFDKIAKKKLLTQKNEHGDAPLHVSCKSNLYSVWPEMLTQEVDLTEPNTEGDDPADLITAPNATTAYRKCLKGNTATPAKSTPKKAAPKAVEKKAKTPAKRKRGQDVEEQVQEEAEEESTSSGRRTRKRTRKSYVEEFDSEEDSDYKD